MISIAQAYAQWNESIRPHIPSDDGPALSESWNDFTDRLCKDGEFCSLQYHYCPAHDDEMPDEGSRYDALSGDREFILDAMGVGIHSRRVDGPREGWDASASHWRVTITRNGKRLTCDYSMGSAHTGQPDREDAVNALLKDAEYSAGDFSDFCSALGYDEDSRKAEKIFRACKRNRDKMERLFTARELFDLSELFQDF